MELDVRLDKRGHRATATVGIGTRSANGEEIAKIVAEKGVSVHTARDQVRAQTTSEDATSTAGKVTVGRRQKRAAPKSIIGLVWPVFQEAFNQNNKDV